MKSGDRLSDMQDVATVRVAEYRPAANKQNNYWWAEENWPKLKKDLVNNWYPYLRGQCDEASLQLVLDTFPNQTELNVLQRTFRNLITYENDLDLSFTNQ